MIDEVGRRTVQENKDKTEQPFHDSGDQKHAERMQDFLAIEQHSQESKHGLKHERIVEHAKRTVKYVGSHLTPLAGEGHRRTEVSVQIVAAEVEERDAHDDHAQVCIAD